MNLFTIDFEDWYHVFHNGAPPFDQWDNQDSILEESTDTILDLLSQYQAIATFFVLGWIAEKYPQLIGKIASHGHEIASHGYAHSQIDDLSPKEFQDDLNRAAEKIYRACGKYPKGFRAPGFSITEKTSWALDILQKEGYLYDSSLFSNKLKYFDVVEGCPVRLMNGLIELPIENQNLISKNILGGLMMRVTPNSLLQKVITGNSRKGIPSILVIHPRELGVQLPKLKLKAIDHIKTYYGLENSRSKLKFLLQHNKWNSVEQYLQVHHESAVAVI